MKLFIHFGVYKSGSSYLQHVCASQKDYLAENGIYFPRSREDDKMKKGLISKGNAENLNLALKKGNGQKVIKILQNWYNVAESKNCQTVLISSEGLVHHLAVQHKLDLIIQGTISIGYTSVDALGFFRNLSDHALSTYKHRAKSGTIPDYKFWVNNVYETPLLLDRLASVIANNQGINWTLRKFRKEGNFMKQAFFKDWLEIEVPLFKTRPNVNVSITLSELKVMNHIRLLYPNVTDYFYEDFKNLAINDKSDDKDLDAYVLSYFAKSLARHDRIIHNINAYFRSEEQLVIGVPNNGFDEGVPNDTNIYEPKMKLSDAQLSSLMKRIQYFNTIEGKSVIVRRKFVGFARRFWKRSFLNI